MAQACKGSRQSFPHLIGGTRTEVQTMLTPDQMDLNAYRILDDPLQENVLLFSVRILQFTAEHHAKMVVPKMQRFTTLDLTEATVVV